MKNLEIDLETYSSVDLSKCGIYKYAEADDFEILLFGYSVDGGEAKVVDLAAGERIPKDILDALTDDSVTKWAFNAAFERICLSRYLSDMNRFCNNRPLSKERTRYLDPKAWKCSMIWSAYLGLPLSLEAVGMVLGLEKQKLSEGKKLIRYFCMPCKPTKANGGRTRNLFFHDKEKWECFKAYNIRDVETEMQIQKKLQKYPVPDFVWEEYHLDQKINDRGIAIDITFVEQAIAMDKRSKAVLTDTLKKLTELNNPNSVVQMKQWLLDNGIEMESLGKKEVDEALKTAPEHLKGILYVRQQLAKSSVKKYQAMQKAACADHRARGMFQFYGANRSGRWAGRIIQLQNLYRNSLPDLEVARELVRNGDFETVELLFDSVPDVLSELIRTAFVPKDGCKFIVSDFSAVEARVLSYLANETWRNEVFAQGKDIYCASASQMFGVPVEKHGVNSHLRQKGKIAELALGYGGSIGALKAMGALEMGLSEEELQPLVDAWRQSNPNIVKFWWDVDRCVKKTVKERVPTETNRIKFRYQSGMLFILLPSGRQLSYVKPRMGENRFGGEAVTYEGIGGTKKWERIESYGPKFVENIVQAYSRDLLAHSMKALERCSIVAHIHDEIIVEADMRMSEKVLSEQMSRVPPWAEGLLLRAEGYETFFYKKD